MKVSREQLESSIRELRDLREASTAGAGQNVDREALFDRIIATPVSDEPDPDDKPRRPRRLRYWRLAVAGLALLAFGIAALIARETPVTPVDGQRAFGAVVVDESEDYVTLEITERDPDPAELREALEAYGFDIRLEYLDAPPGQVGFFLPDYPGMRSSSILAVAGVEPIEESRGECLVHECRYVGFRIPRSLAEGRRHPAAGGGFVTTPIHIAIGREAESPRAVLGASRSAFAPDEILHCSDLLGATVANTRDRFEAMGINVIWNGIERPGFAVNTMDPDWSGPPPTSGPGGGRPPRADQPEVLPRWLLESYIRDAHYIAGKQLLVMTGRKPRSEGDPFLEMIRKGC